jgi:hypothetical protein
MKKIYYKIILLSLALVSWTKNTSALSDPEIVIGGVPLLPPTPLYIKFLTNYYGWVRIIILLPLLLILINGVRLVIYYGLIKKDFARIKRSIVLTILSSLALASFCLTAEEFHKTLTTYMTSEDPLWWLTTITILLIFGTIIAAIITRKHLRKEISKK